MRKLILLAVVVLTLPAAQCGSSPSQQVTESGYSFTQPLPEPTGTRTAFSGQMTVIEHPSMASLVKAAEAAGVKFDVPTQVTNAKEPKFEGGWAKVRPGKFCEVHVLSPAVKPQEMWLGHEVLHCSYGEWHN